MFKNLFEKVCEFGIVTTFEAISKLISEGFRSVIFLIVSLLKTRCVVVGKGVEV